jgi:hypothetical protein
VLNRNPAAAFAAAGFFLSANVWNAGNRKTGGSGLKKTCLIFAFFCLLLPFSLLAEDGDLAKFHLDIQFDPQLLSEIEIELLCNSGEPRQQRIRLTAAGNKLLNLASFEDRKTICQIHAMMPHGYSVDYQVTAEGNNRANEHGCQFMAVNQEQTYACKIRITQNTVPLRVYKKWVGGGDQEPDVEIHLVCGDHAFAERRYINTGRPGGWKVSDIRVDGLSCDVFETSKDTFVADQSDCRGLLIFPARGAECTMVNTKVVKRIEMLNRYGKAIMILVMLAAGLIAVRRYV